MGSGEIILRYDRWPIGARAELGLRRSVRYRSFQ